MLEVEKEPCHTLIDVHVLSALRPATKCDGDTNPEEFLVAIKKFFGAGSTQGFYDQSRRIKLKKMKEPELIQYVAAYQEIIASNPDVGNDDTVGRLFLGGLRNQRLKDRIRSEADTAGKEDDISFFMAQAFIELSEMIQIRDEVLAHASESKSS
ncbi:hypothetical protein ADUPG1_007716 [Aduncisulcus paluster]|uniref:Retrotransposon gag domain-containing protein n=1 Tax=Aduncisulcus paluster TaxID=2918883 RepID=A0ABQ5KRV4_9EUKA|nr:hypothetical protein ADUPG1_007716 [Aduncisulcus paluster]